MPIKERANLLLLLVILLSSKHAIHAKFGGGMLRTIGNNLMSMDFDDINVVEAGPQISGYALGGGYITYRSSIIASLSQLDRGDDEAAMESLRVAIASLTLQTTQVFGLPVISAVMDKVVNKYGAKFPKTISGMKEYNVEIGNKVSQPVADKDVVKASSKADEAIDALEALKNRIRTDFGDEVTRILEASQGYEDLVEKLKGAKTWAKASKWGDLLAGPIFDIANIAFTGWQLHEAIKQKDALAIASGSLGIVCSVVGIGSVIVGSLATTGSVLAATAGPIGALIGCVLTLAALIIDVIATYNPTQKIKEDLNLMKTLTNASINSLTSFHKEFMESATSNGIEAGFNTLYEVNQAMLVAARINDEWDTVKGMGMEHKLKFQPKIVKKEGELLVVGNIRVFDKEKYKNCLYKPKGREEIGYNYYGKMIHNGDGGICVRLATDMVTNEKANMWFWLNGAEVITYPEGERYKSEAPDNVQVGDFRSLIGLSDAYITIFTGGGDDLVQITGVVGSTEELKYVENRCLTIVMDDGYDTISFEGMDTRQEKLKWLLEINNLTNTKDVVGVSFDMVAGSLSYRLQDDKKSITDVKFAATDSVERFIGSPLNDSVKFDEASDYSIIQSKGHNVYELSFGKNGDGREHVIEDNSDTPGILKITNCELYWNNVIFSQHTNIIVIFNGDKYTTIFLKRCKPGIDDFRVQIKLKHTSVHRTKKVSELASVAEDSSLVFPFVPYAYHFDRRLVTKMKGTTYIDLLFPTGPYPSSHLNYYRLDLKHGDTVFSITKELLTGLRGNKNELILYRDGNKWMIHLRNKEENKANTGWKLLIHQNSEFVIGIPGSFTCICKLKILQRFQLDIFTEIATIMGLQNRKFDFTRDFEGSNHPEKVRLVKPHRWNQRDPADKYTLDLKGPASPTDLKRNELVIDDILLDELFGLSLRNSMKLELSRASANEEWHLKISSESGEKILRIDVTLKGVHTILAGKKSCWKLVLNLATSEENYHDLNDLLYDAVGHKYQRNKA